MPGVVGKPLDSVSLVPFLLSHRNPLPLTAKRKAKNRARNQKEHEESRWGAVGSNPHYSSRTHPAHRDAAG